MNFYSDYIINEMIDNEPLDKLLDSIDTFNMQCKYILTKYSITTIHHKYTDALLNDPKVIIAFYSFDQEFCIFNCPSVLVYRKIKYTNEIRYYVLFACTKRSFRGQGYASKLLDELTNRIKNENKANPCIRKIILSSIENAVLFYESSGFRWTRESILEHSVLLQYESYEKDKEYFILELLV